MSKKISRKILESKFPVEYVKNGLNGTRAYIAIKPQTSPRVAQVQASRLLSKDIVKKSIAELLPSDKEISEQVTKAITTEAKDNPTWSEKHQFITTALKLKGYLNNDTKNNQVNIALVIDN